jgi:hypothetical protein
MLNALNKYKRIYQKYFGMNVKTAKEATICGIGRPIDEIRISGKKSGDGIKK